MAVKVNRQGVEIDGVTFPLYSGDMHYWRIERDKWAECLDLVVELGYRFICTYIPWSVHEVGKGAFDFGELDPKKNVGAFIDLCGEKGLFALVRPGPHINAEITYFGFPERLFKHKEMFARTAQDTPSLVPAPPRFFPTPSYASEIFYEETAGWFDAICPVLAPRMYPAGRIVGVQSDNEMSYFFRTAPFDLDYSEPSIALYRRYLKGKYSEPDALNEVYRSEYADFDSIHPPRSFDARAIEDLPYYLDWMEYKEFYLYHGIQRITRMLRERGLENAFFFHNYPSAYPTTPFHIPKMETQISLAGIDLYRGRDDYDSIKTGARFVAGTSRLPFVPELGAGCWLWWKPLFLKDQNFANRAAIMHGIKAFNFYMLVERERWYASPITRDARRRKGYFDLHLNFNRFLKKTRFHEYTLKQDVLLLSIRNYERMEQLGSLLSPLPPLEPDASLPPEWFVERRKIDGLQDSVGSVYRRQWRAYKTGFTRAGYSVAIADSAAELSYLERFKVILAPSFDFMNMSLQRRLLVYAYKGGVLVLGPRIPVYDEKMNRDSRFTAHSLKSIGRRDSMEIGGMTVENAELFEAARPFIIRNEKTCAYSIPTEKGLILHLGFVFKDYRANPPDESLSNFMTQIAALAKLEPSYKPQDPEIETALHEKGSDKILFAANPTGESRVSSIALCPGEDLVDADTGECFNGPAPDIAFTDHSVRIFYVVQAGEVG